MAGNGLNMDYDDMHRELEKLTTFVNEFRDLTSHMTASVNTLCNGWDAEASEVYRQDYTTLANNFSHTAEIVEQLIQSTNNYIADMDSVDTAYAQPHVEY